MRDLGGRTIGLFLSALVILELVTPGHALVPPEDVSGLREKAFQRPELSAGGVPRAAQTLDPSLRARSLAELRQLGVQPDSGRLDERTGRWMTLILQTPLVPGTGVGNTLTWQSLGQTGPQSDAAIQRVAWDALSAFVSGHESELRIDVRELVQPGNVAVHSNGGLIQIHAPRVVQGVPVRRSFLTAVINHGNLILFGAKNWGDVTVSTRPTLNETAAQAIVAR